MATSIYENEKDWQYIFIAHRPNGDNELWGNTQFIACRNKFTHAIEDMEFGDDEYTYLCIKEGDNVIMEWKEGEPLPEV